MNLMNTGRNLSLLTLIVMVGLNLGAQEVRFPSKSIEIQKGDRLLVKAFYGSLSLRGMSKGNSISVSGKRVEPKIQNEFSKSQGAWQLNVYRQEKTIVVETSLPQEKSLWQKSLNKEVPRIDLVISAPGIPTEVALNKGRIDILSWQAPVNLAMSQGRIQVAGMKSDLRAHLSEGSILVKDHNGRISLDTFKSDVNITNQIGELDVKNFSGETVITGVDGNLDFKSFDGKSEVRKLKGNATFDISRGSFTGNLIDGRVNGSSESGPIDIQLAGESANAVINSVDGQVKIKAPSNSNAYVRLKTEKGNLRGPRSLKFSSNVAGRFLIGRLKGKHNGRIRATTESGNIILR